MNVHPILDDTEMNSVPNLREVWCAILPYGDADVGSVPFGIDLDNGHRAAIAAAVCEPGSTTRTQPSIQRMTPDQISSATTLLNKEDRCVGMTSRLTGLDVAVLTGTARSST